MKRKILSVLLAFSMLAVTGCTFHFKTPGGGDDETDATDAKPTIAYKYTLAADKTEFLVNDTASMVTFTVSVSEKVDSVSLTEQGSQAEYTMVDDGAFYEGYGGDDIANDGTYTVSVTIDNSAAATLHYVAVVTAGGGQEETNPMQISILPPVDASTSDQINAIYQNEELLGYADTIKNSTDSGDISNAKKKIVAYFKDLEKQGDIQDLKGNADSESLSFTFANGIKGGYILEYAPDTFTSGTETSVLSDMATNPSSLIHPADTDGLTEYVVDENNIVGNNKALLLSSFDASAADFTGSYVDAYNTLDTTATYDFAPNLVYNATVANYQTDLDEYGMIFINSHGTFYAGDPIICLDEKVTADNILLYGLDLLSGRLVTLGSVTNGTATYAITPAFITYYYGDGALDNTLVYMCICKGYKNSNLVDAFVAAGAGAVTAFSDTVLVSYDKNIVGEYLKNLIEGKTVKAAMDAAIAAFGSNDGDATPAFFKMAGNEDLTIMQMGVINGSFEDQMKGWSGLGDSRTISWLTDLAPTDQSYMAIISTGLGSAESSYGAEGEGSSLQQTFIVPPTAKILTFDYDVVSEEPMEYVNSEYDDFFFTAITNLAGAQEQIVYENVNNSVWSALGGDYFSGGDDTTYDTTWVSKSFDISAYAGQCITLTFHTGDVGDSQYDTAGLLDNIKIYVTP